MSCTDFIIKTVKSLPDDLFSEFSDILVDEYISFSIIKRENITKQILSEKLCDYFEKIELKTGKSFDKIVEKFTSDLDSVVGDRIEKEAKAKKNEPAPKSNGKQWAVFFLSMKPIR